MAIEDDTCQITFTGNNSTSTVYTIAFRFDAPDWLIATHISATGVRTLLTGGGVDYTVEGDGTFLEGTVTTTVAVPVDEFLEVKRVTPIKQLVASNSPAGSYPVSIEAQLDRLAMVAQEQKRDMDNLPVLDIDEAVSDAQASALAAGSSAATASAAATAAAASALLAKFPPGPYSNDIDAFNHLVPVNSVYRKPSGVLAWRQQLDIGKVAFLGDSQTAFGSDTLNGIWSDAYWMWLRVFLGSRMDITPDAARIPFATGGLRIAQFATHAEAVALTDVDYVFIMGGTNDALALDSPADSVADMRDLVCAPIRDAGKVPIIIAALPIPYLATYDVNNNLSWQMSDNVAEQRSLMDAMCIEEGIPFYDVSSVIELGTPGRADPQYMASDSNVHGSPFGVGVLARALATRVKADFLLTGFDPLANTNNLSPNANFASISSNQPVNYSFYGTPGQMASGVSSMVTDADGYWWRMTLTPVSSDIFCQVWNSGTITEDPNGLEIDGILELKVISGELRLNTFGIFPASDFTNARAWDGQTFVGTSKLGRFTAADGKILLRTPIIASSGDSNVFPLTKFTTVGPTVVQFRNFTVRKYP